LQPQRTNHPPGSCPVGEEEELEEGMEKEEEVGAKGSRNLKSRSRGEGRRGRVKTRKTKK